MPGISLSRTPKGWQKRQIEANGAKILQEREISAAVELMMCA